MHRGSGGLLQSPQSVQDACSEVYTAALPLLPPIEPAMHGLCLLAPRCTPVCTAGCSWDLNPEDDTRGTLPLSRLVGFIAGVKSSRCHWCRRRCCFVSCSRLGGCSVGSPCCRRCSTPGCGRLVMLPLLTHVQQQLPILGELLMPCKALQALLHCRYQWSKKPAATLQVIYQHPTGASQRETKAPRLLYDQPAPPKCLLLAHLLTPHPYDQPHATCTSHAHRSTLCTLALGHADSCFLLDVQMTKRTSLLAFCMYKCLMYACFARLFDIKSAGTCPIVQRAAATSLADAKTYITPT